MLWILFGLPGAGKNFVGELLRAHFDFYFYDADVDLTEDMRARIHKQELYTPAMRDAFFANVIEKIKELRAHHPRLAVAQTLAKRHNRQQILDAFPEAKFIRIDCDERLIEERLQQRNDWVSVDYFAKIRAIFEPEGVVSTSLDNNFDEAHILQQLRELCRSTPPPSR
jgi:gluconokinase